MGTFSLVKNTSIFYLIAKKIMEPAGALAAALLFALFPHFLLFTEQILTEALYIPIWVALLASLILIDLRKNKILQWMLAGTFLGLLALTRREALLPGSLMVILIIGLQNHLGWRDVAKNSFAIFLIAGLVLTPWLVRNWVLLGKPVLSSSGGVNFMVGNNPLVTGDYTPPPKDWQVQFNGLGELERDSKAWELSLGWIKNNPLDYLFILPRKLLVLFGPAHNKVLDGADLFLVLLCLPGLARIIRRKPGWETVLVLFIVPVLTITLIALIFVGGWRYRLIIYPGLFMLAGYGIVMMDMYRHRFLHYSRSDK